MLAHLRKTIDFFTIELKFIRALAHLFVHGASFIFMLSLIHPQTKEWNLFCTSQKQAGLKSCGWYVGEIGTLYCLQKIKMELKKNGYNVQSEWFSPSNSIRHDKRCQATNCFRRRSKTDICVSCIERGLKFKCCGPK